MNATEAVLLCRETKAACPQQAFDSHTPDLWEQLLEGIGYAEARAAMIEVAKRQPFVSPSEIRTQVASVHKAVAIQVAAAIPPWQLADDHTKEQQWFDAYRLAIIAGSSADDAHEHANRAMNIRPEPLAIEAPVAALKAQMNEAALELVRKQSLDAADKRAKADEKRERYKRIRAAELARKEAEKQEGEESA